MDEFVLDLLFPYLLTGLLTARLVVWYGNRSDWFVKIEPARMSSRCNDCNDTRWVEAYCRPRGHKRDVIAPSRATYVQSEALGTAVGAVLFWPLFFVYVFVFWKQPESPALMQQRIKELEAQLNL